MNNLKLLIIAVIAFLFSNILNAQVSLNLNIGINNTPRYYYLQDIDAFYDTQASMYIYFSNNIWVHARFLPSSYGHYDLKRSHKVIIYDYRGNRPYQFHHELRQMFPRGHYNKHQKNRWSYKDSKHYKKSKYNKNHLKQRKAIKNKKSINRKNKNGRNNQVKGNNKRNSNGNGRGNSNGKKNRK